MRMDQALKRFQPCMWAITAVKAMARTTAEFELIDPDQVLYLPVSTRLPDAGIHSLY
jgi:hypothetical protein